MATFLKPRWSLDRAALVFALLIALLACGLPLTRTLGPESALLLAITLTPWAAALSARRALHPEGKTTGVLLAENLGRSAVLLLIPVVLLMLNGLRVEPCDPLGGLRFIALGPLLSLVFAALVGVFLGSAVRPARLAIGL